MLYVLMLVSLVAHSKRVLLKERHSCEGNNQGKYLGTVDSFSQCEAKAEAEYRAGGDCLNFMWSPYYSWSWGCRCCKRDGVYGGHSLWNIYEVSSGPLCATVYEHWSYTGAQWDLYAPACKVSQWHCSTDGECKVRHKECLSKYGESYDLRKYYKDWDDRISSFKVYEGCEISMYCGGWTWFEYNSFNNYMDTWQGPYSSTLINSWNDCVSFMMCTCGKRKRRLEEPHELPAPRLGQLPQAEEYNTTDASGSTMAEWEAKGVDRNGEEKEVDENMIDLMERIAGELAQEARATGTRSEEGQP